MSETIISSGICVLVDGGCLNNNKPVSERVMYGSLTVYRNGLQVASTIGSSVELVHTFKFSDNHASNQIAELNAMVEALSYIHALKTRSFGVPLTHITVICDSEYALGWAKGEYKVNSKTRPEAKKLINAINVMVIEIEKVGVELKFQYVHNEWVKTQLGH